MDKKSILYEGKTKKIFTTDDANQVIAYFKDNATAFNGEKKACIDNKGALNNQISAIIFKALEAEEIKTHFIKLIDEREQLCQKVDIIPLEVIIRNYIAGSMSKRLKIDEGTKPSNIIFELSYKNDDLGDPLINNDHAVAIGDVTYDDLAFIESTARKVNQVLIKLFEQVGIILVDFKLEFGRNHESKILLSDEISPDTCRLWDKETMKKLDKDRFRQDLGDVQDAYQEIFKRLLSI